MKHQLIPTFKRLYGDKTMVLVLDNAPYHHTYTGEQVDLNGTKEYLAQMAIKHGMKKFTITREYDDDEAEPAQMSFKASEFRTRAPKGPYQDELASALEDHLRENSPELLMSDLEVIFEGEGYELLWTPAYCPQYQVHMSLLLHLIVCILLTPCPQHP